MKYCEKCGKELMDEAVVCPGCGCAVKKQKKKLPKLSKKTKLLCILGGVVLIVAIVLAVLFMPRNIELDDLTKEPSKIGCLFKYGLPTNIEGDEWHYDERVKFHGTQVEKFIVEFSNNSYSLLDSTNGEDIADTVKHYGEAERYVSFPEYTYENLKITDWGFGISVEIVG